jgi:hypothetical protein
MSVHDIGDEITLWAVFRDEEGAQAAPTTVTLAVRDPDGDYEVITHEAAAAEDEEAAEAATGETLTGVTGVYKATLAIDQAGIWVYRWVGEGTVAEVEPSVFYVRPDPIGVISS